MSLSPEIHLGHYQVRSRIGAGGMGEVYLAQDLNLNRAVALKVLPAGLGGDRDRLRRFEQEACAASALNHPNILTIYEIGREDGTHFIATEYIEGETLRQRLARSTIDLQEALDIAIQIASALAAAHKAKIVHRDIKPENIMLRADGLVKVLDFGLAKLRAKHEGEAVDTTAPTRGLVNTAPGTVMGTVAYMSPEQARGLEVDERTDIWSLGVVLYEMIAGKAPFAGTTSNEIISAIIAKERQPPLARFVDDVPDRLEEIVAKALAKDPEERYQSAKDLLIDLRNLKKKIDLDAEIERSITPELKANDARATTGVQASRPTSSAEYLAGEIKRHRRGAVVAVAAIILLSIAGIIFIYYHNSPRSDAGRSAIDSIAVLPLANLSGDPALEYLSDGVAESLINSLTELRQLRVVARSTAFRYKGKEADPQTVGRELGVRAVLMGRVRQIADTLDIQVDLVDAQTGAQLWGQEYERKTADLLSIKQAIAREVIDNLRLKLSGDEQQKLARRETTNAEAYQFYLKGRYYWNKRTADGIRKAIAEFQQAIDRDPNYALGYVGLADCYLLLEEYAGTPASETLPKVTAALDRALQIDGSLAEAHASSGQRYVYLWRWTEAEEEYQRAISLNPNYPTAHQWYSLYLRIRGRVDEALREITRAQELDPLAPVITANVAAVYLLKNDPDSAVAEGQKVIELNPSFPAGHRQLGRAYLAKRRYDEATAEFQKAVELSGRGSELLCDLGYCYAVTGRRSQALAILKELEEKYDRREAGGQFVAMVYAGLGDNDQAFAWLEKDFQKHSALISRITLDPSFEHLRSDPRYRDLVRRMGLAP